MSKYGVMVLGPAGAGKSTFCTTLITHLHQTHRSSIYINLDPAASSFGHAPDIDIRDIISLDDAMDELQLGPNGGLLACFEYLLDNLEQLTERLEGISDEYLLIFDMPGQIELYTHVPLIPRLVRELGVQGPGQINLCAAYLLEATFMADKGKFFSGALSAMSAMLMLELPHVNVLSKMDLVKGQVGKREMARFVGADAEGLGAIQVGPGEGPLGEEEEEEGEEGVEGTESMMNGRSFERLNTAVANLVDEYGMVSFLKLDATDEDSVGGVLSHIDDAIQFHEAQEPREPRDMVVE